eukprot:TRINITY_DN3318_c0_g2_i1.p1 TRINITY_DN3318_c0_g2~~TRINITY_DN3318_c0_g2_i1.p1  ORF type:complete len:431 (-),score=43.59 TRINITY_DN3318_c0_g2_i1:188-1480(-)
MDTGGVSLPRADGNVTSAVLQHPEVLNALKRVPHCDPAFVDEACARRYLRAHNGIVDSAASALAATIRWRAATKPASLECSACQTNPHSHNLRIVGLDSTGRPVIYTCFSQAQLRFVPEASMEHLTRALEDASSILARRSYSLASAQCVWVVDFHGYSMLKDSSPRTAVMAARLLAHYPERLGRAVIVDAPRVFEGTWLAVKRVINEVTSSKVFFTRRDNGTLDEELGRWAGIPLRNWLLAEINDNRLPACQNGQKEYWVKPRFGGHDPRGEPDFVCSAEFALTYTSRLQALRAPLQDDICGDENPMPTTATFNIFASQCATASLSVVAAACVAVLAVLMYHGRVPGSVATSPILLSVATAIILFLRFSAQQHALRRVGGLKTEASSLVPASFTASDSSAVAAKIFSPDAQQRHPPPWISRWLCCLDGRH